LESNASFFKSWFEAAQNKYWGWVIEARALERCEFEFHMSITLGESNHALGRCNGHCVDFSESDMKRYIDNKTRTEKTVDAEEPRLFYGDSWRCKTVGVSSVLGILRGEEKFGDVILL
jgi:hypothetical protein